MPPERQASMRVASHVLRLAARAPVAVDDEAARVQLLEVDVAAGDTAGGEMSG